MSNYHDDHDDHDHDDHEHHHSNSHDLLVAKCAAMACMFAATVLFGSIPFILNSCLKWTDNKPNSRSAHIIQCLLYFGGGVLLATTFIHLLPEVKEVVEHLQECGQIAETRFALAETLMCAGFFMMFFIEECLHVYLHRHKKEVMAKDDGVGAAFERGHSVRSSVLLKGVKRTGEECQNELSCTSGLQTATDTCNETAAATTAITACENKNYLSSTLTVNQLIDTECGKHTDMQLQADACHEQNHNHNHNHDNPRHSHVNNHSHGHSHAYGHGHSHLPGIQNEDDGVVTSSLRGFGIVFALSLHEIFEGMAIGLEDSTETVWFLFGAVSAHKLVLAFCVGVELIVARTKPILAAVYTITFAITSPIGIGIALAVSHNSGSENSLASAILQGIACGTLLYVVFFEILSTKHTGYMAFLAMLFGFLLMFGLQNIGEEEHSHGSSCAAAVTTESTPTTILDVTAAKVFG